MHQNGNPPLLQVLIVWQPGGGGFGRRWIASRLRVPGSRMGRFRLFAAERPWGGRDLIAPNRRHS